MNPQHNNKLVRFVAGLLPEFFVSYLLMKFFDEEWSAFWLIFFMIQFLYLIIWIFRSIISKILFETQLKEQIINHIYDNLVKRKFPNPKEYYSDSISYLEQVVVDNSIDPSVRIGATSIITEYKIYQQLGQIQLSWRLKKCIGIALYKYTKFHFSDRNNYNRDRDTNNKVQINEQSDKIQFECSNCHHKYSARKDQSGREGKCKECGFKFVVP